MAGWAGKIIGGGIGWAVFGPIGALIGGVIGNTFDQRGERTEDIPYDYYRNQDFVHQHTSRFSRNQGGSFAVAMLVLFAHVIRADGHTSSAEVQRVRDFLVRRFGPDEARDMLQMFRQILNRPVDVREVTAQIVVHLDYAGRLEMCHLLFAIAMADGQLNSEETRAIMEIGTLLGVSEQDMRTVFGSSRPTGTGMQEDPFEVLGVPRSADTDTLKKTYRDLAKKFHPDRVQSLGEEYRAFAEEKFKKIQNAWELIRKERGI
ncbi:MAG: TerB family tellurite resistance protein [Candidatus Delongbacteria bacterium]|nr:TerB family tellurite resistance protein [Candidatus Cloacimonadota bacterium]MCB9473845.1 TerB family tellurite resistance protein [Candidatus Delongbacteria bacterium]